MNIMMQLLRAEALRLVRNRVNLYVLAAFGLLLIVSAVWAGLAARDYRAQVHVQAQHWAQVTDAARNAAVARAANASPDGAKDALAAFTLGRSDHAIARLPAAGGLVLSVRQFERLSPELRVSVESRHSDARKNDVRIMTRFRPKGIFQELRPHATYRSFWGFDGFQETGYFHLDNHWQFRNSTEVHTGLNLTQEGVRVPFEIYPGIFVPAGTYKNAEVQPVIMTNQGAPISLNLQTFFGGFFSGHRRTINPTVRFRGGDALTAELSYQRNDVDLPQGDFVTNLARLRVSYSFTPRIFAQSLIQYNDRADVWSVNLRVGWLQAANTGLFVVYNDTRGLYDLNPGPEREDRSLIIKFSRMFDIFQ